MITSMSAIVVAMVLASADPAALVRNLASEKEAERVVATAALEKLGRDALPALRTARESKDAKLRERAAALLEKIEATLLIKPTLVSLDFQDRPLAEVVNSINQRTGFRLALEPPNDPTWQALRVTVTEANPLPFWEAIDRLNGSGQLRQDPGFWRPASDRGPVLHLKAGSATFPKSFSGPFRVNLVSVHRGHDVAFGPKEEPQEGEEAEPDLERFEVQVQVFAEPHLVISLNGAPKELKVRDDFDQDLVPPPADMTDAMDDPEPGAPARISPGDARLPGTLSIVQFPISLRAPDRPGTTIERLEGFIPLQVASRKGNPLVVSLDGAAGQTFKNDEVVLKFPEGKVELTPRTVLELDIKMTSTPIDVAAESEPPPPNFPDPQPVDTLQNRLEILDAEGHPLVWSLRNVQPSDEGDFHVTLALSLRNGKVVPAQLRYYGLTQAAVEVPFKFSKIPMP